jgi:hypothetical protein
MNQKMFVFLIEHLSGSNKNKNIFVQNQLENKSFII